MPRRSGMGGNVTYAGGAVQGVKGWSIDAEIDTSAYNDFSDPDDWERQLTGCERWSGSFTSNVDTAAAIPAVGSTGAGVFSLGGGLSRTGNIVVQRVTHAVRKSADVLEFTVTFKGDGPLA